VSLDSERRGEPGFHSAGRGEPGLARPERLDLEAAEALEPAELPPAPLRKSPTAPGNRTGAPKAGESRAASLQEGLGEASEVVGMNSVSEALEARGERLRRLCVSSGRRPSAALKAVLDKAASLGAQVRRVPPSFFARFAPASHQGVCAVFEEKAPLGLDDFLESLPEAGPSLVLVLDHVLDPGNLGALARSAWAFGADGMLIPKDRAAGITPAAAKAAAGGLETVPLGRAVNLAEALKRLSKLGYWLVAAEPSEGEDLPFFDFPDRSALILGGEGRGLGRLVKSSADFLVRIPLSGGAESLNVSAAGAVLMYAYRSGFPAG
jgi:23S rRNA (guanosine2251-2'-O)-methyltransferase